MSDHGNVNLYNLLIAIKICNFEICFKISNNRSPFIFLLFPTDEDSLG